MRPLPDAARAVRAAVAAGDAEGVPFVVNARTDAFFRVGDRDPKDVLTDAVERGRAFLEGGRVLRLRSGLLRRGDGRGAGRGHRGASGQRHRLPRVAFACAARGVGSGAVVVSGRGRSGRRSAASRTSPPTFTRAPRCPRDSSRRVRESGWSTRSSTSWRPPPALVGAHRPHDPPHNRHTQQRVSAQEDRGVLE